MKKLIQKLRQRKGRKLALKVQKVLNQKFPLHEITVKPVFRQIHGYTSANRTALLLVIDTDFSTRSEVDFVEKIAFRYHHAITISHHGVI